MQSTLSFEGEEDFFFMNQNLNGSISDLFFDNIIPSEEVISGSPSDSPTSSPSNYMSIPNIQPNIIFKQESNSPIENFQDYQSPKIQPLVENNKRKRINAKVEKEKEKDNKEKTNKNPAPKKIRKKHPEMQTSVTLSREKLLTTSTEEFNKWVEELKSSRSLTQEEVQDIRRQKRLIRNRESAQASRDRKKNEFMMLEKQIKQLKEEKDMALRELSEMKNKMNNLENENLFMRSTIQHNPVLNEMYTGIGNIQNTKNTNNSFINSKTVKNAGVCLFLLIFSFGLFFNVQNSMTQSQPKVYMPQNIPSSLPINVPNNPLRSLGTNARKLLSKTKTQISGLDISNQPTQQTLPVISEQPIVPLLVKTVTTGISSSNETVIHQNQQNNNTIQPNVHLYCLNAKEYIIDGSKDSKDLIISLMLPRNTISQNSPIHNHVNSNDELIEVTCKVLSPKI